MPKDCNAFDFATISDVILRVSYTARDGGEALRSKARSAVIAPAQTELKRLFSARHEFPSGWHNLLHPRAEAQTQSIELDLSRERFPFQLRGRRIRITRVELFLLLKEGVTTGNPLSVSLTPPGGQAVPAELRTNPSYGGVPHVTVDAAGGDGTWVLSAQRQDVSAFVSALDNPNRNPDPIDDVVVVCHYSAP
jgi:hypothetical protein